MGFVKRGRKILAALGVALMLAIAPMVGLFTNASAATAATLQSVSPSQIALGDSGLERRTKATAEKLEGQAQRSYGDAVDSPANQIEGAAKQFSGNTRNRVEDAGDRAKDLARETEKQSETLVDRVKDFFN
ncbi:CsbD family protein [Oculatella sp. LEGE 06141]|uniref:CsbD family protein n=1 Tax=Oculatella sp. LEGE 06141 TaxID=1828648 RepID=UPI001881BAE7|nr:CsbD family protein [Oculatella sp. LEGE 06141]MBE9179234.1 CsbD family protein [Oculatella sp. LEGE 06141]